jgi:hypothetical protein
VRTEKKRGLEGQYLLLDSQQLPAHRESVAIDRQLCPVLDRHFSFYRLSLL